MECELKDIRCVDYYVVGINTYDYPANMNIRKKDSLFQYQPGGLVSICLPVRPSAKYVLLCQRVSELVAQHTICKL